MLVCHVVNWTALNFYTIPFDASLKASDIVVLRDQLPMFACSEDACTSILTTLFYSCHGSAHSNISAPCTGHLTESMPISWTINEGVYQPFSLMPYPRTQWEIVSESLYRLTAYLRMTAWNIALVDDASARGLLTRARWGMQTRHCGAVTSYHGAQHLSRPPRPGWGYAQSLAVL